MSRVVHFEFSAKDPERVASFYSDVFGWKFHKWDGPMEYWMISTGERAPGIDGGMARRPANEPAPGTVNTIGVASLDDALKAIEAKGGKVTQPKHEIPGVGWLAYAADMEGNAFGVIQPVGV